MTTDGSPLGGGGSRGVFLRAVLTSDHRTSTLTGDRRTTRLLSLDVTRGLDVLLMLFVNEMAGVRGTPTFLRHVAPGVDGMTITDVVFPAFLFVAGMAIPLALGARRRRGEPRAAIWRHVCARSLSLIVIGVFMVNAEEGSGLSPVATDLWNVLMTCGVLMAWQASPGGSVSWRHKAVAWLGIALLVLAAFTYRSANAAGLVQLRPQWWGILGLIGWAYFVCASIYLLVGDRVALLVGASAALYALYFADHFVGLSWLVAVRPYLGLGSVIGSHGGLVVSGAALMVLVRHVPDGQAGRRVGHAALFSAGLVAAGLLVHTFEDHGVAFWINKPLATPAWCLLSGGLTGAVWTALFYAVDLRGWSRWPPAVRIAGENPLLIYLLVPLVLSLLALSGSVFGGVNVYAMLGQTFVIGTLRSIVFAWAVVRLCGWLRARGLRPQL
jgi:heparan-alpha-glucosaminide N-acetyltransferase